jgi:hypothetical protein
LLSNHQDKPNFQKDDQIGIAFIFLSDFGL